MHMQLAPANYASKTQHISRAASNYSFPSALNEQSAPLLRCKTSQCEF